ncbi:MAG: FAD-binding domain-containing protein [Pseudomonadota bacterium]
MDDAALPGLEASTETVAFEPTRAAGLARLDQFVSRTGRHYASTRNYDLGADQRSNVSALSPWIRHRLLTEEEVLRATLARHAPSTAEKFVQEVFWRTYFKGWLEQRPSVWTAYQAGLTRALASVEANSGLAKAYAEATEGRTGIEGFDHWAQELVEDGYLHNHARMWFASIWIFTLRLPWQLGADFFLRHLLDGDPASNTLSWRWVAGLHTKGKTYQARASNISKYTEGRFRPIHQLSPEAEPLAEQAEHPKVPVPLADAMPEGDALLLVTEEEGRAETLLPRPPVAALGLLATADRSPLPVGDHAMRFAKGAVEDVLARTGVEAHMGAGDWAEAIIAAADAAGTQTVVTAYAPVGPVASRLTEAQPALETAGIRLHQIRRRYDDLAWPHATKGFFALKQKIPSVLRDLELLHE